MRIKIYILLTCIMGLSLYQFGFAERQEFKDRIVTQETINQPLSSCESPNGTNTNRFSFYEGQGAIFPVYKSHSNTDNIYRIYNKTPSGPYSTIYVYNPYGSMSSQQDKAPSNSFISPFYYYSEIKPKGVLEVLTTTNMDLIYFFSGDQRKSIVGQLGYSIYTKQYTGQTAGDCTDTGIATKKGYRCYNNDYVWYTKDGESPAALHTKKFAFESPDSWTITAGDKIPCNYFYVARCGDGIVDNPNGTGGNNTDGKQGITTNEGFIPWFDTGFNAEVCDDGGKGGCLPDCSAPANAGGFCNDTIINDGSTEAGHGPTYFINEVEQIESCDEGTGNNGMDLCTVTCGIPPVDSPVDEAVLE